MNQLDTRAVIKQLVDAGMPETQAEILIFNQAKSIDERLATKQDVALIQHDIKTQRLATEKDIKAQRLATEKDIEVIRTNIEAQRLATEKDTEIIRKDIESLRAETKKDIELLRAETKKEMQLQSSRFTVRMGAMLVAAVGLLQYFMG